MISEICIVAMFVTVDLLIQFYAWYVGMLTANLHTTFHMSDPIIQQLRPSNQRLNAWFVHPLFWCCTFHERIIRAKVAHFLKIYSIQHFRTLHWVATSVHTHTYTSGMRVKYVTFGRTLEALTSIHRLRGNLRVYFRMEWTYATQRVHHWKVIGKSSLFCIRIIKKFHLTCSYVLGANVW
jgi:hypothetical protein